MTDNTAQAEMQFAISATKEVTLKQCADHQRKLGKSTRKSQKENTTTVELLGTVGTENSNPWIASHQVKNEAVDFHIDTGAEVSVIPDQAYKNLAAHSSFHLTRL